MESYRLFFSFLFFLLSRRNPSPTTQLHGNTTPDKEATTAQPTQSLLYLCFSFISLIALAVRVLYRCIHSPIAEEENCTSLLCSRLA
ncbi:hypothetical protein HOY80DRAFT_975587 [Tuber brumale]|nr:hypothetical protein HOY80DRAFT_975587 [Tuber brumale]